MNPFGWIEGRLRWGGQQIQDKIDGIIYDRIVRTGDVVVAKARQLAPVKTGQLRSSINYDIIRDVGDTFIQLKISIGVPYGIYQEFGTRNIPPHPFIRPALLEAKRIWGFDLNVNFAGVGYDAARGGKWHGLIASTGKGHRVAGYAASASPRWKPLTARQVSHVESRLIPSIKGWHRGNVKRARFSVG